MKIELKDESQTLILTNEELDNPDYIDLDIYDDEAKGEDNLRGFITEFTVSLEDLKCAVDAFYQIKLNSK